MAEKQTKRPVGRPTINPNGKKKLYGFVQLDREIYEKAKEYCKYHGLILGAFVGNSIKKNLADYGNNSIK